jgi:hypothetical protein
MIRQLDLASSTNVSSAFWDDETLELSVIFATGGRGKYIGVDAEAAQAFEQSDSPGKYLHQFLKPLYPWVRL